jgi:hypothetical protein
VTWSAGMDFGYGHNFAVTFGFKDGNRFFITDVVAAPRLDPFQQITSCEFMKPFGTVIFADTENPQLIELFRKHGYNMREWSKTKGSVNGGIDSVRMMFMPAIGDPRLFLLSGDPMCEFLAKRISAYKWKMDAAGNPTDQPDDKNDDECDAMRYMIMNLFKPAGKVIVAQDVGIGTPSVGQSSDFQNWFNTVVAEHMGDSAGVLTGDISSKNGGKPGGVVFDFS